MRSQSQTSAKREGQMPIAGVGADIHGVPIFALSHGPPDPSVAKYPLVTYSSEGIVDATARAKAAVRGQNVIVHEAYTAQRDCFAVGDVNQQALFGRVAASCTTAARAPRQRPHAPVRRRWWCPRSPTSPIGRGG